MGKLTINGKANRTFEVDTEEITVCFQSLSGNSASSVNNVLEDCENFLVFLQSHGISPDQVIMSGNSIEQDYDDNDNVTIEVSRTLVIRTPYNTTFNNIIMEYIQDSNVNVDIGINYSLSNKEQIHEDLLKEAIANSKNKAEIIAATMGQKIIGIDTVKKSDYYNNTTMDWMCCEQERPFGILNQREPRLSDQLKAPITVESESIEVVWIME